MAALATMLRRALPLVSHAFRSPRILQIAAISRQQKLTPDFSRFSRIQQLSTAIIEGEPSADENLIRALEDEIDEAPKVPVGFPFEIEEFGLQVYLHRTYGDKRVRIGVDTSYVVIDDEDNTLESFPAVANVNIPNVQLLTFRIQVSRGKFEIDFADIRYTTQKAHVWQDSFPLRVRDFGPSFHESFCKYLEGREMDASASMSFLFNYIDYKNKRDSLFLYEDIRKNCSRWQAAQRSARKTKLLASLARKKLPRDSA